MLVINLKLKKPLFKSIFLKYFTAAAVLIVIAFLLTSIIQVIFARRYWIEEKKSLLENQALNVSGLVRENTVDQFPDDFYFTEDLTSQLIRVATAADSNILIVDSNFKVILCSHATCLHYGESLPKYAQDSLQKGELFTVSRLGGLYKENQYSYGQQISNPGASRTFYVVVSSSATALGEYIQDNLQIYILSAIAVLLLAFIVLYLMTYRLVQPLREMAVITRQFSNGDFSGRVAVRGKDEVAELGYALNSMAVSLSSLEDMRRSFIANVSHELKTPMTTISGFIDGMLDGTIPAERRTEYLHIVTEETKRLSRLVTAMLDLSRIDSGQIRLNPTTFNLTEALCSTLLVFEQRIENKQIQIEGINECGAQPLYADYDLLQQVVYNLIDNAVKFTEESGTISVHVTNTEGWVTFSVRNTGAGIPATEMPYIFERFYKSDRSRSMDKKGMGLGLYIVKTIVDLHGGEVTVSSAEGSYCEFTVRLPDLQKN